MYTKTTVSSEHVWIYIHPKGKRMRNGTGITIYLLYKHHFAETIQKLYWQNKFGDIVEAPVLYIEEWNNIHTRTPLYKLIHNSKKQLFRNNSMKKEAAVGVSTN